MKYYGDDPPAAPPWRPSSLPAKYESNRRDGERFTSDDLYRARALLPPARRHLVRVGSLKFGRLWAMRRRKDDGESVVR